MAFDDPSVVKLSQLAKEADLVLHDASGPDLERLIAVGGSPQGARPKVLVQLSLIALRGWIRAALGAG